MANKIIGLDNISRAELKEELQNGAKFVVFQHTISILIMTFKRTGNIHFIRHNEGTLGKSIGPSLTSFFLGWWGIPWGPIYTIGSLATNFRGGKDVTQEVVAHLNEMAATESQA